MKNFILLICILILSSSVGLAKGGGVGNIIALGGGGGVGNIVTADIPGTLMLVDYPGTWKSNASQLALDLTGPSNSKMSLAQILLANVVEPTLEDLKAYLVAKFPQRKYLGSEINGLQTLRYDEKGAGQVRSDIYVLETNHNLVRVQTNLKASDGGIETGDKIISTLRLKYQGTALTNQTDHQVTLEKDTEYSILGDCYYGRNNCIDQSRTGTEIDLRGQSDGSLALEVGVGGYDTGKLLDLGAIAYDKVTINGTFLEVPKTDISLSEIYKTFSSQGPVKDLQKGALIKGHVYLIRTISWPVDDTLAKMRVDNIAGGKYSVTYKKLAQIPPADLQKAVDQMNKYTREVEMPKQSGEVTLYSRETWGDFNSASFNFKYATRDNFYIEGNRKHLEFDSYDMTFHTRIVVGDFGGVLDLGPDHPLENLSKTQFPAPMSFATAREIPAHIVTGHTYVVESFNADEFVFAAVKVLAIGPKDQWVRLAWRRFAVTLPYHFQTWLENKVDLSIRELTVPWTKSPDGRYVGSFYFCCEPLSRTDHSGYEKQVSFYPGEIDGTGEYLFNDGRFYSDEKNSGLVELPAGVSLEQVTKSDFDKYAGKYEIWVKPTEGLERVYLGRFESFWQESWVAFEIVSTSKKITVRYRYFRSAQVQPAAQK